MAKLPIDPLQLERTVVELAAAAFKNARGLLTSAQAVLDQRQWPTSFSIAALALEEVGKATLCMTMLAMPPAVRGEFRPDFTKAFTNHQTKAEFAHLVLAVGGDEVPAHLEQLVDDVIASARRTNAVAASGPAEAAAAEPDDLLDFLRQWQRGVDFDALGTYVEASPDEFISHLRAFLRDDGPPPALLLGTALAEQVASADARAALPAGPDPLSADAEQLGTTPQL